MFNFRMIKKKSDEHQKYKWFCKKKYAFDYFTMLYAVEMYSNKLIYSKKE